MRQRASLDQLVVSTGTGARRKTILGLSGAVREVIDGGATLEKACAIWGISTSTYRKYTKFVDQTQQAAHYYRNQDMEEYENNTCSNDDFDQAVYIIPEEQLSLTYAQEEINLWLTAGDLADSIKVVYRNIKMAYKDKNISKKKAQKAALQLEYARDLCDAALYVNSDTRINETDSRDQIFSSPNHVSSWLLDETRQELLSLMTFRGNFSELSGEMQFAWEKRVKIRRKALIQLLSLEKKLSRYLEDIGENKIFPPTTEISEAVEITLTFPNDCWLAAEESERNSHVVYYQGSRDSVADKQSLVVLEENYLKWKAVTKAALAGLTCIANSRT